MSGNIQHESSFPDRKSFQSDLDRWERIESGTIDLNQGPASVRLGRKELGILVPERDLPERDRGFIGDIECVVVDPSSFNSESGEGYIRLPNDEVVELGRQSNSGGFDFSNEVSRHHVELTRTDNRVYVRDLRSTNGTYLIRLDNTDGHAETWPTWPSQPYERKGGITSAAAFSIAAEYHPDLNEDAYFIDKNNGAAGVFDGIGGMPGSDRAARIAAGVVEDGLGHLSSMRDLDDIPNIMYEAHKEILRDSYNNIGTTATVAKVFEDGRGGWIAVIASAGDSRAYLYRDGKLEYLTLDHAEYLDSLGEEEGWAMQETLDNATDESKLKPHELKAFNNRHVISSCLGVSNATPDISVRSILVKEGDRLLLTTDGITDNLTHKEMEEIIAGQLLSEGDISKALVEEAGKRSRDNEHLRHKRDDKTAVVLTV